MRNSLKNKEYSRIYRNRGRWHASCFPSRARGREAMAASHSTIPVHSGATQPQDVTLLELVGAISEVTENDQEVVA